MTGRLSNMQQKISRFLSPDLILPGLVIYFAAQFPINSTGSLREPAVRKSQALLKSS